MRIALVGPGRAGTALALALQRADHDILSVTGRDRERTRRAARRLDAEPLGLDAALPPADLLLITVSDGAIASVAEQLVPVTGEIGAAVHVSGATSVEALKPLSEAGLDTGSFHPLQTLPSAEAGAAGLEGAWIAITADPPLRDVLHELATSIGGHPFDLDDTQKATYHAAAAAAANFPVAALAVSHRLFAAAGVPFEAARPLVEAAVANAFDHGPAESLTGPVARGDVGTVDAQLAAIAAEAPQIEEAFRSFVSATAAVAGTAERFEGDR